jgi:hypothetical protein
MREHVRSAITRRDDRLARIRRLTLWITGGAAAASLGLGAAFAHTLPGHGGGAAGSPPGAHAPAAPRTLQHGGRKHLMDGHRPQGSLAAPRQAPGPAPARPAPVTSGGS